MNLLLIIKNVNKRVVKRNTAIKFGFSSAFYQRITSFCSYVMSLFLVIEGKHSVKYFSDFLVHTVVSIFRYISNEF